MITPARTAMESRKDRESPMGRLVEVAMSPSFLRVLIRMFATRRMEVAVARTARVSGSNFQQRPPEVVCLMSSCPIYPALRLPAGAASRRAHTGHFYQGNDNHGNRDRGLRRGAKHEYYLSPLDLRTRKLVRRRCNWGRMREQVSAGEVGSLGEERARRSSATAPR